MGWASAVRKVVAEIAHTGSRHQEIQVHEPDFKRIVTIDFETYYDGDYTLRKLSTSEYIRDPRFKIHMMGLKVGNGKTKIIRGDKVAAALKMIPWQTYGLLCHNTAFDGFILSEHFGVVPAFYYDTLSMARGLHKNDIGASLSEVSQFYGIGNKLEGVIDQTKGVQNLSRDLYKQLAEYCTVDVDLTAQLLVKMVARYPEREIQLIDKTIRMFTDPVLLVDIPRVQKEWEREIKEKEDLLFSTVGTPGAIAKRVLLEGKEAVIEAAKKEIGSNERFAELLRAEGINPPRKPSPAWLKRNGRSRDEEVEYVYAFAKTDLDFTRLQRHRSKRVRDLVEARLAVKSSIGETRAARFLTAGANGAKLPVLLHYYGAHTGRHSAGNKMNMQNLERGGELRKSIKAPKGHRIVVADSGQIEARVNGWLWHQKELVDGFQLQDTGADRDVYCKFGDLIYGREITKDDKEERFVGKVAILGLGYQMGAPRLQTTLALGTMGPPVWIEMDVAQRIVRSYRNRNYKIVEGWEKCGGIIDDMARGREGSWGPISWEKEKIWLPNGMALKYPGLRSKRVAAQAKAKVLGEEYLPDPDDWNEGWVYDRKGEPANIYGGLLDENIVQALSRIIVAEQLLVVAQQYRVVMFTHDEIVACVPEKKADKAFEFMVKTMRTPPHWAPDLPLFAEGGHDVIYSK